MDAAVLSALWISVKVATCATIACIVPALAIARWLARGSSRGRSVVETLCALPLVLPPTAVGFLLLALLGVDGPLGRRGLGLDLLLTWQGAVIASAVMAFPLVLRGARTAFEEVDPRLERMGASLGLSRFAVWTRISLPLARRGLIAAAVLGFGRALGEFGATLLVAGNLPGETQTMSLLLWEDIQLGQESRAVTLVGLTALLAFVLLFAANRLTRGGRASR
ncbi:MAG: molybdate ABC transporter permease subunit [Planctomycetes bacterium]|nr:molybdate ABC transporter permease subunit [Planctomycetota bacterium]MCB9905600.1 molybdate ABC transporter permease subunit [Planctomycetota bacterium]